MIIQVLIKDVDGDLWFLSKETGASIATASEIKGKYDLTIELYKEADYMVYLEDLSWEDCKAMVAHNISQYLKTFSEDVTVEFIRKPYIESLSIKKIRDKDPEISYLDQDGFEDRKKAYHNGEFDFAGVYVNARVLIPNLKNNNLLRMTEIESSGQWSIESDSNDNYFKQVAETEFHQLKANLEALNVDLSCFDAMVKDALDAF